MDKGSIKIIGDGFIHSGKYKNIKIIGSAKSKGDVECEELKICGDTTFVGDLDIGNIKLIGDGIIYGSLKAKFVKVNGNLEISGSCEVEELIVNGNLEMNCDLKCNNVTIRGDVCVNKNLEGENIRIYGEARVKENIVCEKIFVEGDIKCEGLLNAENVEISPRSKSYCREIGATNIRVKEREKRFLRFIMQVGGYGRLESDLIEGDFIELENSIVKDVRGKSIDLISKCKIENVEYNEKINVSKDSTVKNSIKVS
ncbi:MAG: polymer-forming cytoskeletal protein [Romboutsia sp.]